MHACFRLLCRNTERGITARLPETLKEMVSIWYLKLSLGYKKIAFEGPLRGKDCREAGVTVQKQHRTKVHGSGVLGKADKLGEFYLQNLLQA